MKNLRLSPRKVLVVIATILVLQILLGVSVASAAPPASGPIHHVVQPGETLSWIAWHYGVSQWAIAQANYIRNPDLIYAGQVLYIPYGYYYPHPHYGYRVHCIHWGETLSGIAWRYGVSVWDIARVNHLWSIDLIYAGKCLVIP